MSAVQDFTLTVMPGEILALLGPSGCGKTTVLRLIVGFEKLESGRIEIGDRLVSGPGVSVPPEQRQVGMVFQHYALFPHLSVADNVAYGLRRDGRRRDQVREALALVGLSGLETRMPHELSGGQQQRVALARALAPRPKVLLLDEPFSNLDADRRASMRAQVREILKRVGMTALFVTHDQEEALFMGDRVAVMNMGRLEQIGAPEAVFGAPATRFVAEFMGQTDFLPGEVVGHGIRTEVGVLDQRLEQPVGARVEVAFRPDDVQVLPDPAGSALVAERHYQGTLNLYRIRLPSGRTLHSYQAHTLNLEPGTPVRVILAPGHPLAYFARDQTTRQLD